MFDRGLYSDTLASVRVLREYLVRAVGGNTPQKSFCRLFSLSYPRMEQLVSTLYAINRYVCVCVCTCGEAEEGVCTGGVSVVVVGGGGGGDRGCWLCFCER